MNVAMSDIGVSLRYRRLDSGRVSELADSIKEMGLLQPIVLTEARQLVVGLHRLEACKSLGWEEIPATILPLNDLDAKLAEIDENLIRNELTALERGEHLVERKRIYLLKYPETAPVTERGGPGRGKTTPESGTVSFVNDTASHTNRGRSTVREEVEIATNLTPEAREILRDSDTADNKTELKRLSRMAPEKQAAAAQAAVSGHVRGTFGTGENEWYTPDKYLTSARHVMGSIDLDPASSDTAQGNVRAGEYFSVDNDGLSQPWHGRVWLNPPYAQPLIAQFVSKVVSEWSAGHLVAAIMLTHNYTDTSWFHEAMTAASVVCFTRGRINFISLDGVVGNPTQGQAFFYFGADADAFYTEFSKYGFVVVPA